MNKIWIIVAVAVISLIITGCGSNDNPQTQNTKSPEAKLVKVQPVLVRTLIEKLELPGSIQAENVANVLSTAEGKISKINAREGDAVKSDQVLARISPLIREDIINSARLLVQSKQEALTKNPSDSQLRAEVQQAEQDYHFALQQYKEIPVTSPMSGEVSKCWVDVGDMVPAKYKLFEIQSSGRLLVDVPVSELDIHKLLLGQSAQIKVDPCPDKLFSGKITRIHPQIDTQTRNGLVEIQLPHPCPNLRAGMFIRAIFVTQKLENVLAIPVQAIIDRPQHRTCFIVNDEKTEEVILTTGITD